MTFVLFDQLFHLAPPPSMAIRPAVAFAENRAAPLAPGTRGGSVLIDATHLST
jgi:hypothetical protein